MSRRWSFLILFVCAFFLLISQATHANFDLRVNESATRVFLKELAPEVSLAVENGSRQSLKVTIKLELLNPGNDVSASNERKVDLKPGKQNVLFTLPFKSRDLTPDEESKILWYRIHYRVTLDESNTTATDGIISLSQITPDLFELSIVGPRRVVAGKPYSPRVRRKLDQQPDPA